MNALHALDQADTALATAGLVENDIFRKELRRARTDFAELARCANGLKNALDLRHGAAVYRQWGRSIERALIGVGEIDVPAAQAAAAERHDAWADLLAVAEEAVIADSAGALRDYNMTRLRSAVARVKESP